MNRRRLEPLRPLVDALRVLLEKAGPRAEVFLNDWPRELIARPVGARPLPVVAALRGLSRLAAPAARALVEAVETEAHDLDWRQTYGKADFGERFLENYGFNEWIGGRGAFVSDRIACGVLLLGHDTEYPDHSHEAEELYLPLAGRAFWRVAQSGWRLRPPGEWIHHPSWTIHAIRTEQEPLLAAYVWRGGDLQRSRASAGESLRAGGAGPFRDSRSLQSRRGDYGQTEKLLPSY